MCVRLVQLIFHDVFVEDGEARQREEEKQGKEKEEMKKAEFIPQTRQEGRYKGEDTMPSRVSTLRGDMVVSFPMTECDYL